MYQDFKYVLYHETIAAIEKIDISQGKEEHRIIMIW